MDQTKPEGQEEVEEDTVQETAAEPSAEEAHKAALREQEDKYLRLLAEYDNYRKRSQKERRPPGPPPRQTPPRSFSPSMTTWSVP